MANGKLDFNVLLPYIVPIVAGVLGFYVSTISNRVSADAKSEQVSKDVQAVMVVIEKFDNRFTNLESSLEKILIMNERFSNNFEFLDKRVTALENENKNK